MINRKNTIIFIILIFVSALFIFIPIKDLSSSGQRTLAVFVFAILCWTTEVIPISATGGIVVAMLAFLIPPVTEGVKYSHFLAAFANPTIVLFAGGFFLATALQKYKLDTVIARSILNKIGNSPRSVLGGIMLTTAFLSMWMSNTATTTLMVAAILPVVRDFKEDPFSIALILGIPFAANVGGIGTPIGTPPNAIAIQSLANAGIDISFLKWVTWGMPIALVLTIFIWWLLLVLFPPQIKQIEVKLEKTVLKNKHYLILGTVILTVLLWLTTTLHKIPSAMIALIPPMVFMASGILNVDDFKNIGWDVLVLMSGGIALGIAMQSSGLSTWLMDMLRFKSMSISVLILIIGLISIVMSTFMSNTAATNILIPLAIAVGVNVFSLTLMIALMASCAMSLPVSTPPNAIAYSSGMINSKYLRRAGLIIAVVAIILNYAVIKIFFH
ncbi:DASS family sodium-coupled anion symporter [bacterium]|nr:DASS family sodium-coupled anion symporter [bacterium]